MTDFNDPAAPGTATASSMTLSDLLGRFSDVRPSGTGYVVPCPAHVDKEPSLNIGYNPETRKIVLNCWSGCSATEVVEALGIHLRDLFNVDLGDASAARSVGKVPDAPSAGDRGALAAYLDRAAAALPGSPALEYISHRFGITPEKGAELGLGYDDGSVGSGTLVLSRALYHDTSRVVVPFNDFDGHPQYLQGRALSGSPKAKWSGPNNPDGAAWAKYGFFPGGSGWGEVILTEGPGDALTAAAVGYDAVLVRGAGLGTNLALAEELAAGLSGRRVVVAGDNDAAGVKFARDVSAALHSRGISVFKLVMPLDADDVSKWRELAGSAFDRAFIEAVQSAPHYGSDEITAEEISHEVTQLFTDVFNAKALLSVIREQGADVKYTSAIGFIVYRAEVGTWVVDEANWIRTQAQTVAPFVQRSVRAQMDSMAIRVANIDDREIRKDISDKLEQRRGKASSSSLVSYVMSTRGIDSMLTELRALPGIFASFEDFDQHPHLLAVGNGVVSLEDGELLPYSEETKDLLLIRRVEVPYLPGARNPRWERFLAEIFDNHPELPAYMQRLIGYGITGFTTEQAIAVLYGGGSNGKGVLVETLTGIFKGVTTTTPFQTFEQKPAGGIPNDVAALKGARLVMASEGEQSKQMAEAVIKRLTGGDTISARFMRKEFFEFVPTFLILLATNYKPNFRGQDFGLWRRVKLIPFDRRFTSVDKDKYLTSKFLGARVPSSAYREDEDYGDGPAGILAWAVEGARLWFADSLSDPEVVTRATADYKETSDNLAEYYGEYIVKTPSGSITGQAAWQLYQEWCDEEKLSVTERWQRSTFWKGLEERGAVKHLDGGTVTFTGIRRRRPSEAHGGPVSYPEPERVTESKPAHIGSEGADAPTLDAFKG